MCAVRGSPVWALVFLFLALAAFQQHGVAYQQVVERVDAVGEQLILALDAVDSASATYIADVPFERGNLHIPEDCCLASPSSGNTSLPERARGESLPVGTQEADMFVFEGHTTAGCATTCPVSDVPIHIDGVLAGSSDSQGYFAIQLTRGTHSVRVPAVAGYQSLEFAIDIHIDTYYVICLATGRQEYTVGGGGARGFRRVIFNPYVVGVPGGMNEQVISMVLQDDSGIEEAQISVGITHEDRTALETQLVSGDTRNGTWEARWNPPSPGATLWYRCWFFLQFGDGETNDMMLFFRDYRSLEGCGYAEPHTVSTPTTPSGPSSGQVSETLQFSTGGSTCNRGHPVEYRFHWGDATSSSWSSSTTASHTYSSPWTYYVWAQARCAADTSITSYLSANTPVTIGSEPLPHAVSTPTTPSGPSSGQTGVSLNFSTGGSSCSQGHSVQYRFDWGDGKYSTWSSAASASHAYSSTGTYYVRAQARCAADISIASSWSEETGVAIGAAALPGVVVVAPNPITSAGTAFFYALPEGTSTAKLMIFNVAGQPVFETALSVTSSRFPSAGTWNPVDQDGIPLANGPYVYVLIADGKVIGRGKMVIQR